MTDFFDAIGNEFDLTDNDGITKSFVLMDIIDYEDHTYAFFIPQELIDTDEERLVILEVEDNFQEIVLNTIQNEVLLNELYDIYCEEHYDQVEEDEEIFN